ncbi:MAG: YHS domain-containing protein [Coprothermobacter sp.]|nr:YHS domain-containing protein [Coprothermobacter sp.]
MSKTHVNEFDPVCGMLLKDTNEVKTEEFEGKTYGFCSQKCKDLFRGNPKKYIENPASHKGMPAPREVPEKH